MRNDTNNIVSRACAQEDKKDEFVNGMNKKTLGNGHNRKIIVTFAFELLLAATVRDGWGGFFLLHFCYIFATFLLNLATFYKIHQNMENS